MSVPFSGMTNILSTFEVCRQYARAAFLTCCFQESDGYNKNRVKRKMTMMI